MFGLSTRTKNCQVGLLVDIQSASITLSLVARGKQADELIVIWKLHTPISINSATYTPNIQKKMLGTLLEAFMQLQFAGIPTMQKFNHEALIADVQIIFSNPWISLHNELIIHKNDEPFRVTEDLLEELAHQTVTTLEQATIASLPKKTIDYSLAELTTNYYPVSLKKLSTNVTTTELRFLCITTQVDQGVYDQVIQLVEKATPRATVTCFARPVVLQNVIKSVLPQLKNYCICDIDLEITALTFVNTSGELEVIEISFGINTLIRQLTRELDQPADHVRSLITNKTIHSEFIEKSEHKAVISNLRQNLQTTIYETITKYQGSINIPKTIVYPHNEVTDWFIAEVFATSIGKITKIEHTTIYLASLLQLDLPHEERQLAQYFFHNHDQINKNIPL